MTKGSALTQSPEAPVLHDDKPISWRRRWAIALLVVAFAIPIACCVSMRWDQDNADFFNLAWAGIPCIIVGSLLLKPWQKGILMAFLLCLLLAVFTVAMLMTGVALYYKGGW